MKSDQTILYFAYGSNMNIEQMAYRCPTAVSIGYAELKDYQLAFRGNGYATVLPKEGEVVHGVLWKLEPQDERHLDTYEGYPSHYEKQTVTVRDAYGENHEVMLYVMAAPMRDVPQTPGLLYLDGIAKGYEAFGLPKELLRDVVERTRQEMNAHKKARSSRADKHTR